MQNLFEGDSYQAQFALIIYTRLMSREWINYADVMARYLDFESANELPYNVSNCDGYGELKKAFPKVCKALEMRVGEGCVEKKGSLKDRYFRYVGKDENPFEGEVTAIIKKDIQDYYQFCQDSAGFFPSVWLDHFFSKTKDWFEITKRRKEGLQIIGSSVDRQHKNIKWLPIIYECIRDKKVLKFEYQEKYESLTNITFHPHYIKEFNGRWHVFGHAEGKEPHDAYDIALDRIVSCPEVVKGVAYMESQVRYPDFFDDIIGTTHDAETPIYDNIIVRIHSEYMFGLMESKPIHLSQRTVLQYSGDTGYGEISLRLRPNNEFYGHILQMGADLEIIEPSEVRDEMAKRVKDLITRYT